MTILAPYDCSPLSKRAVLIANDLAEHLDRKLVVGTVVPEDPAYAVNQGWIEDEEEFDPDDIVAAFHTDVTELAPVADFTSQVIAKASKESVGRAIRKIARQATTDLMVIGSRNAGQITRHTTTEPESVGESLVAGSDYDVLIVRSGESKVLYELLPERAVSPSVPGRDRI